MFLSESRSLVESTENCRRCPRGGTETFPFPGPRPRPPPRPPLPARRRRDIQARIDQLASRTQTQRKGALRRVGGNLGIKSENGILVSLDGHFSIFIRAFGFGCKFRLGEPTPHNAYYGFHQNCNADLRDRADQDRFTYYYLFSFLSSADEHHNADYDHDAFLGREEAQTFDELSPEESKERLGKIVAKIDKDGDGKVTEAELKVSARIEK